MSSVSASSTSSSTAGVRFDVLWNGVERNYSFNVINLKSRTFEGRKKLLIKRLDETIKELELHSDKIVEKFIIGKTYAQAKTGQRFDPINVNTWRADGISSRWRRKYKNELEYDGLVVLGAVNKDMLKDKPFRDKRGVGRKCSENWNQESYALALESALISHYAFETFDPRLANGSFHTGSEQGSTSAGYVIYVAFKYQPLTSSRLRSKTSKKNKKAVPWKK